MAEKSEVRKKTGHRTVEKKLLSSQIEEAFTQYIMTECRVGDRLPNEFLLAEKFGTSRATIRAVIRTLVSEGMLSVRQGSGTYVKATVKTEADPLHLSGHKDYVRLALDLFDVRLMLEPEIAAKAAENATDSQIEELEKLKREVEELIGRGEDHIQKDIEFHTYIAKCSGNFVVQALIPIIQSAVTTFGDLTERNLTAETIRTHKMVCDAIKRQDSTGAYCAMTTHLAANYAAIQDMIYKKKTEGPDHAAR